MLKREVAPTGSTGNATFPASGGYEVDAPETGVAFTFEATAIGATPTVTSVWQGSVDGVNFFPVAYVTDATDTVAVAAKVRTTVGVDLTFLANPAARIYRYYRLVVSANTNVTYRAFINTPD